MCDVTSGGWNGQPKAGLSMINIGNFTHFQSSRARCTHALPYFCKWCVNDKAMTRQRTCEAGKSGMPVQRKDQISSDY